MSEAKKYFHENVLIAMQEWRRDKSNKRLAMILANDLNNLVEYQWRNSHKRITLQKYRDELASLYRNIGLIRDIADSHKHLELDRRSRTMTNANQVSKSFVGYGKAYGLRYGGGNILSIVLDNGNTQYFDPLAEDVFEFWVKKYGE